MHAPSRIARELHALLRRARRASIADGDAAALSAATAASSTQQAAAPSSSSQEVLVIGANTGYILALIAQTLPNAISNQHCFF